MRFASRVVQAGSRGAVTLAALTFAAVCYATGAVPSTAHAQMVRGTLVESPGGTPIPGGTVSLLDTTGVVVDSTRSSAQGTFILRAPTAGVYVLHFSHAGYASVPSSWIRLAAGATVEHRFSVPLISGVAIQRMAEVIDVERRLQSDLAELCGERPRTDEAGILVGVVRRRPGGKPLAGAIVRVVTGGTDRENRFEKATVSSANGVYVICNVPAGAARTRTELLGYRADDGPVEIRTGEIAWYDVYLRAR